MFLSSNIWRLLFVNFKVHNVFSTPLYNLTKADNTQLNVSTHTERKFVFKIILGFIYCLCQWIQIFYKIRFLNKSQVILAMLANGSISLHFVFVIVHYNKRHQIADLFNNFVSFEKRHNGNKIFITKFNYYYKYNLMIRLQTLRSQTGSTRNKQVHS